MIGAWAKLLWISAAVAAVAAAAQLGVADALGITRWETNGSIRDWTALLTWIAFCYAVAVLSGGLVGQSAVRRQYRRNGVGMRITATFAATLGAGAVVGLAWLPASAAEPPAHVNPGLVVSITAGAGVVAGFLLTLLASAARQVAVGLQTTIAWLWLAAVGCAVAGLLTHEPYPSPRLGVLDAPQLSGSLWSSPNVMVGVAAVVGLVVASFGRVARSGRFGVAMAGFGGPAIVAAAYLVAGPGTSVDRTAQAEPYLAALIAAGAGLVASVLIAMPGRRVPVSRQDLDLDDLRPIAGDVVSSSGRAGYGQRAGYGDRPDGDQRPFGDQPSYAGTVARPRSESHAPPFAAAERRPSRPADRSGAGGPGWDADTWPGTQADTGKIGGRVADARTEQADPLGDGGSTYRGGTYSSSGHETSGAGALPAMGQPTDAHEAWLRDLGPAGRHSFDERQP